MIYGSVCSGIEAATVAWHPLGWRASWFSEIEKFPCRVLKYRYPNIPNLGNMLNITSNSTFINNDLDLLVGGTPCQSFSVAGLRKGLADERGNLALEYCRILWEKRRQGKPIRWFVWENVPGALSSYSTDSEHPNTETSDFANILTAFRECGYSCAWRVLDAQYFGVPQRRRRIFVVGYFGTDWRPPAAVLFDGQSLYGDITPRRKKKQDIAGTLDARPTGGGFPGSDGAANGHVVAIQLGHSQQNGCGINDEGKAYTLEKGAASTQAVYFEPRVARNGRGNLDFVAAPLKAQSGTTGKGDGAGCVIYPCWWDGGQISQTLDRVLSKGQTMPEKNRFPAVLCYPYNQVGMQHCRSNPQPGDPSPTLSKNNTFMIVPAVRRLTPMECERLQGFPDNYTLIPDASDTARYSAIGNSMAVPVMQWLGKRIDLIDKYLTILT